jgi:hypothetical protein
MERLLDNLASPAMKQRMAAVDELQVRAEPVDALPVALRFPVAVAFRSGCLLSRLFFERKTPLSLRVCAAATLSLSLYHECALRTNVVDVFPSPLTQRVRQLSYSLTHTHPAIPNSFLSISRLSSI